MDTKAASIFVKCRPYRWAYFRDASRRARVSPHFLLDISLYPSCSSSRGPRARIGVGGFNAGGVDDTGVTVDTGGVVKVIDSAGACVTTGAGADGASAGCTDAGAGAGKDLNGVGDDAAIDTYLGKRT